MSVFLECEEKEMSMPKPCPFCGSESILWTSDSEHYDLETEVKTLVPYHVAGCNTDGCRGKPSTCIDGCSTPESAWAKWDQRA